MNKEESFGELEGDKFHDECGVVGIFNSSRAANLSYFSLYALQHRGQESGGIAVSDGEKIRLKKNIGLVSEVFNPGELEALPGNIAVGHVRYATAGGKTVENAQPFLNTFKNGSIALAHNGQLVNHTKLREILEDFGSTFSSSSDSEVILKLIVRKYIENGGHLGTCDTREVSEEENQKRFVEAVVQTVKLIKGSFALCIMTENMLIGVRDPNGIRPLCLGQIDNSAQKNGASYILASESCAIDAVNASFLRDLAPGEILVITKRGIESINIQKEKAEKRTCIFEYVYFARPDSQIDGIPVQKAREMMGAQLAREDTVSADVVIGVPDSGIGAALGYSREKKIPYAMGIVKNKYIGRTFIAPTQAERENMVFVKLNAIRSDLEGKRVIVIDDSIVRGTTSRRLVQILRRAGAREVHFRVSSPPVKFPCHLGIDTPTKAELISSLHDVEEIRKEIGADSLAFISLKGMISALRSCNLAGDGFCEGCFNGIYPV